MGTKQISVYHYNRGVGEPIVRCLTRAEYSAQFIPVDRQAPRGVIADDITLERPERPKSDLVFLSLNFGTPIGMGPRFQEGLEELVEIRKRSQVPVVMVTGGGTDYRDEAMRRGASGYLTVPFEERELIDIVNGLIGPSSQS